MWKYFGYFRLTKHLADIFEDFNLSHYFEILFSIISVICNLCDSPFAINIFLLCFQSLGTSKLPALLWQFLDLPRTIPATIFMNCPAKKKSLIFGSPSKLFSFTLLTSLAAFHPLFFWLWCSVNTSSLSCSHLSSQILHYPSVCLDVTWARAFGNSDSVFWQIKWYLQSNLI